MRTRRRVALLGFGVVALVVSVYNVALSDRVVGALLQDQLSRQLRAPCAIDRVTFSFAEGLRVEGLTVLDPSAPLERSLMRVDRARLDFRLGLFGRGFRISDVEAEEVHLSMSRLEDGSIPLLRVLRPRPRAPDAPPAPPPTVRIAGGTIEYTDARLLAAGRALSIEDISGTLRPAQDSGAIQPREHVLSVSGRCNLLGGVSLTGTLRADDQPSDVTVEMAEIQLGDTLADALSPDIARALREMDPTGTATLRVRASGRSAADAEIAATLRLLDAAVGYRLPDPIPEDTDVVPGYEIETLRPVRVSALEGALVLADGTLSAERMTGRLLGAPLTVSARIGGVLGPRDAWELDASAELTGLHVSSALQDRLPFLAMRIVHAYGLDMKADLSARLQGTPAEPQVSAEADVLEGFASYVGYARRSAEGRRRGFPWRVRVERGKVRYAGRRVDLEADAVREGATVRVQGSIDHPPGSPALVDVSVVARDVDIGEGIRNAFGERAARIYDPWGPPSGRAADVSVHVYNDPEVDGSHAQTDVVATFDGRARFVPDRFPAEVVAETGTLRIVHPVVDGERVEDVVVEGVRLVGEGFVLDQVDAHVRSKTSAPTEDVRIRGRAETLERAVIPALGGSSVLSPALKETIAFAAPRGAASFDVHLRRDGDTRDDRVTVRFEGTDVAGFARVPLPVDDVRGSLDYVPGRLRLSVLDGRVHGAPIVAVGWLEGPSLSEPHLRVAAEGLSLGGPIEGELGPWRGAAEPFFRAVRPTEDTRADLEIQADTDDTGALQITIDARKLRGPLRPLGLALTAQDGQVRYAGTEVTGSLDGRLGSGEVALAGFRLDTRGGAFRGTLEARGLHFPEDLAGLLAEDARAGIARVAGGRLLNAVGPEPLELDWDPEPARLTLRGAVSFGARPLARGESAGLAPAGELFLDPLDLSFAEPGVTRIAGRLTARGLSLDLGLPAQNLRCDARAEGTLSDAGTNVSLGLTGGSLRILERRISDLACDVEIENGVTAVRSIRAQAYDGALTGSVSAGTAAHAFEGRFAVRGANAEKALLAERDMGGVLDLDVAVRQRRDPDAALEGEGRLEVRDANLAEVPVVAVVVGALEPGQFRTATVPFTLDGDWMRVDDAALESSLVAIRGGTGSVNLKDGRLTLNAQLELLMSGPLGWIWRLVRETLFRVEVTGSLRNPVARGQYFTLLSRFFGESLDESTEPVPADGPVPYGDWPW